MTQIVLNISNKKDLPFIRTLSKRMGWTIANPIKSGLDEALDDITAGRVKNFASVEELFDELES